MTRFRPHHHAMTRQRVPADAGGMIQVLWTPADIITALWLDANDASTITVATGVSQWDDKSGNGNHFVQGIGSMQPSTGIATIGGLNAIRFDPTTDENLQAPDSSSLNFDSAGGLSYFGVMTPRSYVNQGSGVNAYMSKGVMLTSSQSYGWRVSSSNNLSHKGGADYEVISLAVIGQSAILSTVVDQGLAIAGHLNGTQDGTDLIGTGLSDNSYGLMIGGEPSLTQRYSDVDFGEIIIVSGAVSTGLRQTIEGYLGWKWGLEANLPAWHPYRLAAPAA